MRNLYNILTYIVKFHLKLIAGFNKKINLGVQGRKRTIYKLDDVISRQDKTLWFHCASLGEFEQGLPVFEEIKQIYQDHKIVLTFFSPSGFEVKKNASIADVVVYLPLDTKHNAKRFLDRVHPDLVVFVKYEIWPNYLYEISQRQIKALLISALFRPGQSYFKSTGRWMLKSLATFDRIFVQNDASKHLLEAHGLTQVTVSGDTRFDRVLKQLDMDNALDFIEEFKQDKLCFVAGSTWPEDEKVIVQFINEDSSDVKFIIAPHNIKSGLIKNLQSSLTKSSVLYSEKSKVQLSDNKVLILDSIGLLSKVYNYADIAYVGGALGTSGLHNTLEPAVFGIPIIIGPNHDKFPEALAMIANGGMFSISTQEAFNDCVRSLIIDDTVRNDSGLLNSDYIIKNRGAVVQIINYIRK